MKIMKNEKETKLKELENRIVSLENHLKNGSVKMLMNQPINGMMGTGELRDVTYCPICRIPNFNNHVHLNI